MMEAYLDESGTQPGSPAMCVAGYLFEHAQRCALEQEWSYALAEAGVRYFHMGDCVHGVRTFKALPDDRRKALIRTLIGILKERMAWGVAIAVNEQEGNAYISAYPGIEHFLSSAYTLCVMWCVEEIRRWVAAHCAADERVTYCFERGHAKQGEADRFLIRVKQSPMLQRHYCYAGHGFAGRKVVCPLQTADLLAWEWCKRYKDLHGPTTRPLRASLQSLLQRPHRCLFLNNTNIGAQALQLFSYDMEEERGGSLWCSRKKSDAER
jgi:hypothetical protein